MRRSRPVLVVAALMVLIAISAVRAQTPERSDTLNVVASFSILGDFVRNVGGHRVRVATLIGPGGDAHVYAPTPADAKTIGAARLIVLNGLGFEGWMDRLAQASATQASVVVASAGIAPRQTGELRNPRTTVTGIDPHAWQSVHNAEVYVANIRDGLIRVDPQGRDGYEANAAAYLRELDRLDADIRRTIAVIPEAHRKLITTHDAFGYFAADYGIAFIAAQGVSTETDSSAREVARIIRLIRAQNLPALFFESAVDPRLLRRIAAETGARVGGTLFAHALTDAAGPAPTYIEMMRHNVREIAEALK